MTRPDPESALPPRGFAFAKLEALGNDFALVDARGDPVELDPKRVARLADRRTGIGFDQLLALEADGDGAFARVSIFNADGSQAEQCGNGMRAIAAWLDRGGELKPGLELATPAGRVALGRTDTGDYSAELPGPEPIAPEKLGLAPPKLPGRAAGWKLISMGNPHLVVDWPDPPTAEDLAAALADLEQDRSWRNRVNLGLAHVDPDGRVLLRVHERGAGPTPACGSAACAAAWRAAKLAGDGSDRRISVVVTQPGGTLVVDLAPDGSRLHTIGPARVVYEGHLA